MKKIFGLLFSLFFCGHILAQEFTASVSQNPVAAGEQFQLTFTLNSGGNRFQAPSLSDFNVLSGPNQSSSMQFINGSVSQSISFSFILQARNEGTFKIGPAFIEANGKKLQSNIIQLKVTKGNASAQKSQGQGSSGGTGNPATGELGNNVFLRVSLNKSSVYQGEEIIATYKLYFRINVMSYGIDKIPSMNGFWTQDVEMPKQPSIHKETVDGVAYNVAEIKKILLFPQRAGNLELPAMEAQTIVRQQVKRKGGGDIFDQLFNDPFFGGVQDVPYKVMSNSLKINVKELPPKPADFTGAVGKFNVESFLDRPETKTNDPVTLKIKVTGKGNLKLLDAPKLNLPPDIESYEPKSADNINVSSTGISGTRTFEYLLIPRHSGDYKISAPGFSFFDSEKKEFVNVPGTQFNLKVQKGQGPESQTSASNIVNKEDISLLGKDIRFIHLQSGQIKKAGNYFFGSFLYYLLLLLPFPLFGIFLIIYNRNKELLSNVAELKKRKANKIALKRLSTAKEELNAGNKTRFYEEINKALWGYASDKLDIPMSRLNRDIVKQSFQNKGVENSQIEKFMHIIEQAEFARYAPGAESEMGDIYNDSVAVITKMEEQIK